MDQLTNAIESLYQTFARYPRPSKIESCPCGCTKPEATAHLIALPLRDLRYAEMSDYAFSAITTQGSVDDFRYLLPRMFQGVAEENIPVDPEIIFGKLDYAKWTDWPADEIAAVRSYLRALWNRSLKSFPIEDQLPSFFEIETVLASIASTGEPLETYLQTWTDDLTTEADEHLIQFVTMWGKEFSDGRTFHEAFWQKCTSQALTLRKWLLQPNIIGRISESRHLLRSDGFEHLFEPALNVLRSEASISSA